MKRVILVFLFQPSVRRHSQARANCKKQPTFSTRDILINGTAPTPQAARGLDNTLAKYPPKGGQSFE